MPQKPPPQHEPVTKRPTCVAFALKLLGRRSLTQQSLQDALTEAGYPEGDIAQAVAHIRTWGYINDARLGDAVVAAALRRKKGPAWLRQQLKERRVPQGIASRCVAALQQDAQGLANHILAQKFSAEQLAEPRTALRALRLLQRRGFDGATCRQALAQQRGAQPAAAPTPWADGGSGDADNGGWD